MGEFEKNQDAGLDKRTEEEIIAEKLRNAGQEQEGGKQEQFGGKEDYSGGKEGYSDDQGGKPQG